MAVGVIATGAQALVLIKLLVAVLGMEVDVVWRGTPEAGRIAGVTTGGGGVPTGDVVYFCRGWWAELHLVALARL